MAGKSSSSVFDMRRWLETAKAAGQLKEVEKAALHLEVGGITELNAKRAGPAILFDKFEGFKPGFRVLTGSMLNASTIGLTLGFEGEFGNLGITNKVADTLRIIDTKAADYPMEFVNTGPVMENVMTGNDIDLSIFPIPIWHEQDGGPYIGTGNFQIHQDPDSGWVNVACYRVQLFGKDKLGNFIAPGQHGNIIRKKYWDQGKPCPVVVCFGAHPIFLLFGSSNVPVGVDELSWIGAIGGQRVPVIKGPVTGLPIPADAEIVVEGFVHADSKVIEGPFGEFTGYYAGGIMSEPYIEVKAVYYRNQPILLGSPASRPPNDMSYYFAVMRAANIKEALRRAGVGGVKGVWVSEAGCGRNWIVTSITQQFAGHAMQAAGIAALCQPGGLMARYSIVVDDDIDPSNNDDVIWAMSTRSDPATDIDILRQCWSTQLDPTIDSEAKNAGKLWNSRAIINACKRFDRIRNNDFPPHCEASPEYLKGIKEKWASLFK